MKASDQDLKEQVFGIMSRVFGVPLEEINEDSSADTIEKWDSLGHMNLVLALEEELGVQFTDSQIVNMLSAQLVLLTVEEARS